MHENDLNARNEVVERLNRALTHATDSVGEIFPMTELSRVQVKSAIAEAFAPVLIETGLINGIDEEPGSNAP